VNCDFTYVVQFLLPQFTLKLDQVTPINQQELDQMNTIQIRYLTEKDLSARWKIDSKTLRNWRCLGQGPRYSKFGRCVRYNITDIGAYEDQSSSTIGDVA